MTVGELKSRLEDVISVLDDYQDNDKVKLVSNTYFLNGSSFYLGTREGFTDLRDLEIIEDDYDEDEDMDESVNLRKINEEFVIKCEGKYLDYQGDMVGTVDDAEVFDSREFAQMRIDDYMEEDESPLNYEIVEIYSHK